jgi:C-terminal processing protease CtpA/Prc
LKETRDSVRDATRDDQDDSRGSRQSGQRSSASRSSDEFDDIHGTAQSSQRSTRDTGRDDSRRDTSRDDQSYSRGQRDDSRDDQSYSRSQREERDSQRDDQSRDFSRDRDDFRDRDVSRDSRQSFDSRQSSRDFDQSRDQRADFRDSRDDSRSSRTSYSESRSTSADFRVEDVRPADIGLWFDRSNSDGLLISDVSSSGAITRFGFREGDQILTVNGYRVSDQSEFVEYLFDPEYRQQRVEVVVWRNGRRVPIQVQPSVLVQEYTSYSSQPADPLEEYGLVLDDRYPNNIMVWKVLPRTPAYYAGIRPGDTIVSWDGYRVSSPQQFTSYVQRGNWSGPIDLQVSRNRQLRQLQLEMNQANRRTALRPSTQFDARGNADVDRALPGRENRIENRIERREDRQDFRDGSYGAYGTQGGTYYTQPGTQGTYYTQPGVQGGWQTDGYGAGATIQGQAGGVGVRAGADARPGLLPRVRGR